MHKILTTSLSVHWAAVFAMAAANAADLAGAVHPAAAAAHACAHALVAMLFLWTALAAWSERADDAGEVARLALAVAVPVLAFSTASGGMADHPFAAMVQLAALAASYLVIRGVAATARAKQVPDHSGAVARRLAAAAAHGSMLTRLSHRGQDLPEGGV